MPVEDDEVKGWVSGVTLPPRHLVGLEDPLRVPTAAYFYWRTMGSLSPTKADESSELFEKLFNARAQAMEWAFDEVDHYGGLFATLDRTVSNFKLTPTVTSISAALLELLKLARQTDEQDNSKIETVQDGEMDRPAIVWMVSLFTPILLLRSGITENLMPQMIPILRFLNMPKHQIEQALVVMLEAEMRNGQSVLASFERGLANVRDNLLTNRTSKTWDAAIITTALPDIKRNILATVLEVRPQGAGYIKSRLSEHTCANCNGEPIGKLRG